VAHTGQVGPAPRGIVRLLNTADGGVLCLAGLIDAPVVDAFVRRYGREPARIGRIDAASVTGMGASGVELLLDHLDAAQRSRRPMKISCSPVVERLLAEAALQT
jgi:anti-anti-sigma regulatory factor